MAEHTHDLLKTIVYSVRCKPGWTFRLQNGDGALRLVITVKGYDSAKPDDLTPWTVAHYFPVPTATYNERTWSRWIFERCRGVENHELGEWFRVGDEMPFAPLHGPGEDPYTVHEFRPAVDALTTQDGSIRDPYGWVPDDKDKPAKVDVYERLGLPVTLCPMTKDGQHKLLIWQSKTDSRSGRSCRFCHQTWEWFGKELRPTHG